MVSNDETVSAEIARKLERRVRTRGARVAPPISDQLIVAAPSPMSFVSRLFARRHLTGAARGADRDALWLAQANSTAADNFLREVAKRAIPPERPNFDSRIDSLAEH